MPFIQLVLIIIQLTRIIDDDNKKCFYYKNFYDCVGGNGVSEYWDKWDDFCFQTPYRGGTSDPVYRESYQDMHYLVGYAKQEYYSNRTVCNVSVYTRVNKKKIFLGSQHELIYTFGEIEQKTNYFLIYKENGSYIDGLSVSVRIINNTNNTLYKLNLEQ